MEGGLYPVADKGLKKKKLKFQRGKDPRLSDKEWGASPAPERCPWPSPGLTAFILEVGLEGGQASKAARPQGGLRSLCAPVLDFFSPQEESYPGNFARSINILDSYTIWSSNLTCRYTLYSII